MSLDDQIRATISDHVQHTPSTPDFGPGVTRRLRQRSRRRIATGAAATAAVAAIAVALVPGASALGRNTSPTAPAGQTTTAPAPTTSARTVHATPTAAPTSYPTRELSPRPTPWRAEDGGVVTSFGTIPMKDTTPVRFLGEHGRAVYYLSGPPSQNLHRLDADGKDRDLGPSSGIVWSPDGTQYAHWAQESFGKPTSQLVVRRTADDSPVSRTDVPLTDGADLVWSSHGLFLLDTGGDAAGYYTLRTVLRADPATLKLTPVPAPHGVKVVSALSGDAVMLLDHPTPTTTRVQRWIPGGPGTVAEHTFTAREMPVEDMDIPSPFQPTPDGTKILTKTTVYDATTFAVVGRLAPLAKEDFLRIKSDNTYAYMTMSPEDLTGAKPDPTSKEITLACRLTGDHDCVVDPLNGRS